MMTGSASDPRKAVSSGFASRETDGALTLCFTGDWSLAGNPPGQEVLAPLFAKYGGSKVLAFDATGIGGWDSRFLVFCARATAMAGKAGMRVDESGLPQGAIRLLRLAAKVPPRSGASREKARDHFTERVGGAFLGALSAVGSAVDFVGEITLSVGRLLRGKAVFRASDLLAQIKTCGVDALPIASLISMLVGLILAYVGAVQLKDFGAQIYTSTLVGIAMVRVLSAVMTGIIMAGRTGAAFAAELGAMQVNEEIDALSTFGVDPVDFLVLPRVVGMTLMMPLLCLYADLMGVLGGFIVGVSFLGITPIQYLEFTKTTVPMVNLWIGLTHSLVFGVLVSMAGCYQGMRCGRSATGVGRATTRAVVTSIVSIIVATSILTIMCNVLGI